MATTEHLEKRSGERNVDSRFQVQLEEDGAAAQDRADSSLWPKLHREQQGLSQVYAP